ncbi:hypothetical protein PTKIN_Ptkin07bG0296700 [Pterospermum kingtungense]
MDSRTLSSESSLRTVNLLSTECVSLSSSKTPKETENVNIAEVSSPAKADSPTAPSSYVKSHEIVGEKTKGCNNTRLAGTSTETSSASEGTFNSENFNAKLGAQNQGRKESDQDALPSETAKDISGAAAATIASNSTIGRQVEGARVLSYISNGMLDDDNNVMTTDEPLRQTHSTGLTELADLFPEDVTNQDEVESFLFDHALVTVEGYRVNEAYAPILRNVMEKHGDIAANCIAETVEGRSFFLEKICEIMQTLQTTKFEDITQAEVKKMIALVGDLGRLNLDVEWLQKRLEEILEAIELIKQFPHFKERREKNAQTIEKSERTLRIYEARIEALKEMARWEKEKMDAAQAEDRDIIQKVSNLKPKVKLFIKESLLHDL